MRFWIVFVLLIVSLSTANADQSAELKAFDTTALRLAIKDLTATYGKRYPNGPGYLARLNTLEAQREQLLAGKADEKSIADAINALTRLKYDALLANPLVDFGKLLVIKRSQNNMGLTNNWESNSSLPRSGFDNELDILSPVSPDGALTTIFRPQNSAFFGDIDLHWNADRMLFDMTGDNGRFQLFEMNADGSNLHLIPTIEQPDVDNYDACYLPNGNILFTSTACFIGVPCVRGGAHVTSAYLLDTTGSIRRLTFDQEHNWCPTVMNDGRVMYLRWEYADLPHYVSRIMFRMNPDGTNQAELYGSNSYWPNSMFYARPIPNDPSKFVAIISGHHDTQRMGEMILFDPAKGRFEADGVVQRIPGRGKRVEPIVKDDLVNASWPKFLHPWPLSDKYFIVSCKPNPQANWGIYLVDTFDNMLLLKETPGCALLEPIPLKKTPTPPVIPDKIKPGSKDALMSISDIYRGPGLNGVPRGTVKNLRLISYQFSYQGMGGQQDRIGFDGPWDVKRIIGTVPVEADGSAYFKVPANTPISIQPLDKDGKALQIMRSWTTAMPGEYVTCVGCHEKQNTNLPVRFGTAMKRVASEIKPWYGPARGFSFRREVQPVLNRYCISCHSETGKTAPDLTDRPDISTSAPDNAYNENSHFPPSYFELRYHVRGPGIESDMNLLNAGEYHADTTRLVRMLQKGHHGVVLDRESWDRIITWIDLNTPAHGTWTEVCGVSRVQHQRERRIVMNKLYANLDEDAEEQIQPIVYGGKPFAPQKPFQIPKYWTSVDRRITIKPQAAETKTIEIGNGIKIELVRVTAGNFIMGSDIRFADEAPDHKAKIDHDYWIGKFEVTNQQYALFDPSHNSHLEDVDFLQFDTKCRGFQLNTPAQPVCRVSWYRAMDFCKWLSKKTGLKFTLPTETQWECACRAGTDTDMKYGPIDTDFSKLANLADYSLRSQGNMDVWGIPAGQIQPWRPAIEHVNDGYKVSAPVGSYQPNAWGLYDMQGNVAEWTASNYLPYSNPAGQSETKVVRGGSWYDRPFEATSSYRAFYQPWMRVYDVGFRVVVSSE